MFWTHALLKSPYHHCRSTTCWMRIGTGPLISLLWRATWRRQEILMIQWSVVTPGSWSLLTLATQQVGESTVLADFINLAVGWSIHETYIVPLTSVYIGVIAELWVLLIGHSHVPFLYIHTRTCTCMCMLCTCTCTYTCMSRWLWNCPSESYLCSHCCSSCLAN